MSCCGSDAVTPRTPTLSSGQTAQKAAAAVRCDQARLLSQLRGNAGPCCTTPTSNKSAIYSSVLTQDHATRCQPSAAYQAKYFPKVGVPESVRIQRTQTANLECSVNQMNPATRFSLQTTFVPQAPCPPPTATQLNSTTPKPTFAPGCQPSRFF